MPRVNLPGYGLPIPIAVSADAGLVPATGLIATRPTNGPAPAMSGVRAQPNGHSAPELQGSDFLILDEPKKTTVGILYARDGHGKTYWACRYCPEPVVVIGFDGRGERTIKQIMRETGRKIYYLDAKAPGNAVQMSHDQAQAAGTESLALASRNYEWAIDRSIREWGCGTLALDTSKELTDIVKLAVRGRVDRPNPKSGERGDFGKSDAVINRTLKYFCDRARDSNLNLMLLARSKPIYDGREDTGRITWDTDKIFSQAADWIVGLNMVSGMMPSAGGIQLLGGGLMGGGAVSGAPVKPTFELMVTNPKCAYEETGKVYRQAEWEAVGENPFVYAMQRLLPGSRPEDWK